MHSRRPRDRARPVFLFKAPALSVQKLTEPDGVARPVEALMLVTGGTIPLEVNAAELLVGYLQVVRAYFSSFPGSRKLIAGFYTGLARQLETNLREAGRQAAGYQDVSDLIERLGCISDWQQKYPPAG